MPWGGILGEEERREAPAWATSLPAMPQTHVPPKTTNKVFVCVAQGSTRSLKRPMLQIPIWKPSIGF